MNLKFPQSSLKHHNSSYLMDIGGEREPQGEVLCPCNEKLGLNFSKRVHVFLADRGSESKVSEAFSIGLPDSLRAMVINERRLWKLEKGGKILLQVGGGKQCAIVCNGLLKKILLACESFVINSTWDEKCCVYENIMLPV